MKERMLRRGLLPTLALSLAAVLVAGGCGGEDEQSRGPLPVFDVRCGDWATVTTLWETGVDTCQEGAYEMADTLYACVFDPIGVDDPSVPANLSCDVTRNGDEVSFSCSASNPQYCTDTYLIAGMGRVSETAVDLTLSIVKRSSGPDPPCPQGAAPCTLWAGYSGEWLSAGDSTSAGAGAASVRASVPLSVAPLFEILQ